MKRSVFCSVFLFLVASASAQEKLADATKTAHRKKLTATAPVCKNLSTLAALVDAVFDGQKNGSLTLSPIQDLNKIRAVADKEREEEEKNDPILAAIRNAGTSTETQTAPPEEIDSVWDTLIDCSQATRKPSEREEALRVAAIWEWLRADAFQKMYRAAASPVTSARCRDLDRLAERIDAAVKNNEAWKNPPQDFQRVLQGLRGCAEDSEQLNSNREQPEALKARRLMFSWEVMLYNSSVAAFNAMGPENKARHEGSAESTEQASTPEEAIRRGGDATQGNKQQAEDFSEALAKTSNWILNTVGWPMSAEVFAKVAAHNRALCDQVITVAGLTPNGLALYVPPLGQQFMAKNSQNYPRMCLLEDTTHFMPGVPSYLLAYAYSENAFAGFQPVTRTTTVPVSGSGKLMNASGNQWNFTYTGTMTEMDTIEAPYVIQSHSLYLNAYDENGNVVSRHSITVSSQAGGDASYAAGYNGAQLIALLWNNPSHLIKSVLKDVQKDSQKYTKK
ncbi:MAG: hypothetical protein ACYDHE_14245 [Candidatus Acidiferrales bacterium]